MELEFAKSYFQKTSDMIKKIEKNSKKIEKKQRKIAYSAEGRKKYIAVNLLESYNHAVKEKKRVKIILDNLRAIELKKERENELKKAKEEKAKEERIIKNEREEAIKKQEIEMLLGNKNTNNFANKNLKTNLIEKFNNVSSILKKPFKNLNKEKEIKTKLNELNVMFNKANNQIVGPDKPNENYVEIEENKFLPDNIVGLYNDLKTRKEKLELELKEKKKKKKKALRYGLILVATTATLLCTKSSFDKIQNEDTTQNIVYNVNKNLEYNNLFKKFNYEHINKANVGKNNNSIENVQNENTDEQVEILDKVILNENAPIYDEAMDAFLKRDKLQPKPFVYDTVMTVQYAWFDLNNQLINLNPSDQNYEENKNKILMNNGKLLGYSIGLKKDGDTTGFLNANDIQAYLPKTETVKTYKLK